MLSLDNLWDIHKARDREGKHDAQLNGYLLHATFSSRLCEVNKVMSKKDIDHHMQRAKYLVQAANWLIFMESEH